MKTHALSHPLAAFFVATTFYASTVHAQLSCPAYDGTKVQNPTAAQPTSVVSGATRGAFTVGADGTANYRVALEAMPGSGNLQPALALDYNSNRGNGLLGVGFVLSGLSTISLCSKNVVRDGMTQAPKLDGTDKFCLDGAPLEKVSVGAYGAHDTEYRTAPDAHIKVVAKRAFPNSGGTIGPSSFLVYTKDGLIHEYGPNFVDHNGAANVAWPINSTRDRTNNVISYHYVTRTDENGRTTARWIDLISYGHGGEGTWISFEYDTRPDKISGYAYGTRTEIDRRLKTIRIMRMTGGVAGQTARTYTLAYRNDGVTGKSKIASITECGMTDTDCKLPTVFEYEPGVTGFDQRVGAGGGSLGEYPRWLLQDFTGDGRDDLAFFDIDRISYGPAFPPGYSLSLMALRSPSPSDQVERYITPIAFYSPERYTVAEQDQITGLAFDYNYDGKMDILARTGKPFWTPILMNAGNHPQVGSERAVHTETPFGGALNKPDGVVRWGDFNGDGLQDFLEYVPLSAKPFHSWNVRYRSATLNPRIHDPHPFDDRAFEPGWEVTQLRGVPPTDLHVFDLNGDSKADLVYKLPTCEYGGECELYMAGVFDEPKLIALKVKNLGSSRVFADLNGDGLLDLVSNAGTLFPPQGTRVYVYMNTGLGFHGGFDTGYDMSVGINGLATTVALDVDGDGIQELLTPAGTPSQITHMEILRVTENTATTLTFGAAHSGIYITPTSGRPHVFPFTGPRVFDYDGDGQPDLIMVEQSDTVQETWPRSGSFVVRRHQGSGNRADMMTGLREGSHYPTLFLDPTVQINYASLTDPSVYLSGTCVGDGAMSCSAGRGHVVKTVKRDSGVNGVTLDEQHLYIDSRTHRKSGRWLGFAEHMVVSRPSDLSYGAITTRQFYSNTKGVSNAEPMVDPRLMEAWTFGALPDGRQFLDRTTQEWDQRFTAQDQAAAPAFMGFAYVKSARQQQFEFTSLGDLAQLTPAMMKDLIGLGLQSYNEFTDLIMNVDVYGNVTNRQTIDGEGNRTQVQIGHDINAAEWLIDRPKQRITSDLSTGVSPPMVKTRTLDIEEFLVSGGKPTNLPKKGRDSNAGAVSTTVLEYSTYGNVIRTTAHDVLSGKTRETCIAYDIGGVFPHSVTNALGHTSYVRHDPLYGGLQVSVDANGLRTDYTHDRLGRMVKITRPDGGVLDVTHSDEMVAGEKLRLTVTKDATGTQSEVIVDRAGRPLIERFKALDGVMRHRRTAYDARGMVKSKSTIFPLTENPLYTQYAYDDRLRLKQSTEPGDPEQNIENYVRRWEYDARNTTYTDTRGAKTRTLADPRGRHVRTIEDYAGANPVRRDFRYGPFGLIDHSVIVDANGADLAGTRSSYVWDARGNLVSRTDTERGLTSYPKYNGFDEVERMVDANGIETAFTYDVLGRAETRTATRAGAPRSTTGFTYDTGPGKPLGKLVHVEMADYVSGAAPQKQVTSLHYEYDGLGRVRATTQAMPSDLAPGTQESFGMVVDYDALGRMKTLTYPQAAGQRPQIAYDYAPAGAGNGQLKQVRFRENAFSTITLWEAKEVDAQGRIVTERAGNGVTTDRVFNWRGAQTLQDVRTGSDDTSPDVKLQLTRYVYDGEGNLPSRLDWMQRGGLGLKESFTYDALNRVATMSMGDTLKDGWTYDALGNLQSSTLRGAYVYNNPFKPHQITSVSGGAFTGVRVYGYDAAGNRVSSPDGTVVFNDFQLPAQMLAPSGQVRASFLYSPTGERVRKTSADAGVPISITYFAGLYERERGVEGVTEHRFMVPAYGKTVAVLRAAEQGGALSALPTLYPHSDHLGSANLFTANEPLDEGTLRATVKDRASFDAFGLPRKTDWLAPNPFDVMGAGLLDQGFTGHSHDRELGLINMRGRVYDPKLGRFLTPDRMVPNPAQVQGWNPYMYTSNNPLNRTDPSGFNEECPEGCPTPPIQPPIEPPPEGGGGGGGDGGCRPPYIPFISCGGGGDRGGDAPKRDPHNPARPEVIPAGQGAGSAPHDRYRGGVRSAHGLEGGPVIGPTSSWTQFTMEVRQNKEEIRDALAWGSLAALTMGAAAGAEGIGAAVVGAGRFATGSVGGLIGSVRAWHAARVAAAAAAAGRARHWESLQRQLDYLKWMKKCEDDCSLRALAADKGIETGMNVMPDEVAGIVGKGMPIWIIERTSGGKFIPYGSLGEVATAMAKAGPYSRALIAIDIKLSPTESTGHLFNIVNRHGHVFLFEVDAGIGAFSQSWLMNHPDVSNVRAMWTAGPMLRNAAGNGIPQ